MSGEDAGKITRAALKWVEDEGLLRQSILWQNKVREAFEAGAATPHLSVIYTNLKVRCRTCGRDKCWRYLEAEDVIEILGGCCDALSSAASSPEPAASDERADFESWISPQIRSGSLERRGNGYANHVTQSVWTGWQGRAAAIRAKASAEKEQT
jgi:hypothetical protein